MDNILYKNIFKDQDLYKLSPDYRPTNVSLRMQLRRTLVKDTHMHTHSAFRNSNWSRKSIKKSKEHYNIHKDLVKLRNDFSNINLKNQMTLKCLDALKTKPDDDELLNECIDNSIEEVFLQEFSDDETKLMICNDTDFKLNMKSKPIKLPTQNRNNEKHKDSNHISGVLVDPEPDSLENNEDILRVKCYYSNKTIQDESTSESISTDKPNIQISVKSDISVNNFKKQESDLQKLLTMMAISSKPNNSDETFKDVKYKSNNTLQGENTYTQDDYYLASPNSDEIESILSVIPIRVEVNDKEKVLIKKFVAKWKQYVQNRKNYVTEQRRATLDKFFDKVTKKKMDINQGQESSDNKAKQFVRDYSTYQHRYKVQKHIIAFQKVKLEEQNRLIEELKYNKIIEASRQSVDIMREEVRKTYFEMDRQLKPKIKCLTNELKIHELEEPSLILHCLKVPQFLQRMEKRAREREEKHAIIRERRRQMEEERIRLKQQAELAKAEMDKEEKIKRMKELKEKRKREKIENIRRKQYAERMRALIVMADLHYEKTLMAKYGIRPLRLLIDIKRDNVEKARAYYRFQLKNNVFLHWMWYTEDTWFERNYKAEELHRKNLLRKAFEGFKMNHYDYRLRRQVAEDYYDLYVTQLVFRKLCDGVDLLKKEYEVKFHKAVVYHSSNLLFKTFTCWRTLPALNALKREQEARKARWREKVLQVVPDYTPPED